MWSGVLAASRFLTKGRFKKWGRSTLSASGGLGNALNRKGYAAAGYCYCLKLQQYSGHRLRLRPDESACDAHISDSLRRLAHSCQRGQLPGDMYSLYGINHQVSRKGHIAPCGVWCDAFASFIRVWSITWLGHDILSCLKRPNERGNKFLKRI